MKVRSRNHASKHENLRYINRTRLQVAREDSHASQRRISVDDGDDERVFGVSGGALLVLFINRSEDFVSFRLDR